jgi:hypothetical protein
MPCPLSGCTVLSKRNLGKARVLFESFKKHHSDGRFIALLVDDPTGYFDPAEESFPIMRVEDLQIPHLDAMRMRYDVVELCSAVRPWFILQLFKQGCDRIAYIDPDILICRPLKEIESMLDHTSTILSPHLTAPLPDDGCLPDERTILASGAFNSGFIACKNDDAARALLEWWKIKLEHHAHMDPASGLFGDQRWMDLMPGMFQGVAILRDPTMNVAYWNLHEKTITMSPQQRSGKTAAGDRRFSNRLSGEYEEIQSTKRYLINNESLTFFHFSGYKPELPDQLSIHQNRFALRAIKPLAELCDHYRSLLDLAGHITTGRWDYTFDHFDNGVAIVPTIRRIFDAIDGEKQFPRPFETGNPQSFFGWLTSPATQIANNGFLMNLHIAIHKISIEASARFQDPLHCDRERYARWLLAWEQRKQFKLPAIFTDCLEPLAKNAPRRSARESMHAFLIRRHDWKPYQAFCRLARKIIGHRRFEQWKPTAPILEAQPFKAR